MTVSESNHDDINMISHPVFPGDNLVPAISKPGIDEKTRRQWYEKLGVILAGRAVSPESLLPLNTSKPALSSPVSSTPGPSPVEVGRDRVREELDRITRAIPSVTDQLKSEIFLLSTTFQGMARQPSSDLSMLKKQYIEKVLNKISSQPVGLNKFQIASLLRAASITDFAKHLEHPKLRLFCFPRRSQTYQYLQKLADKIEAGSFWAQACKEVTYRGQTLSPGQDVNLNASVRSTSSSSF